MELLIDSDYGIINSDYRNAGPVSALEEYMFPSIHPLRTDLPATHLSAKSGHFGAERVPERSQRSPMVQMKAESKTFHMAYHKIWIHILGYD